MYVRSSGGGMVLLSSLVSQTKNAYVPTQITQFDIFRSIEIDGAPRPGVGSGDAILAMNALAKVNLGPGLSTAWVWVVARSDRRR